MQLWEVILLIVGFAFVALTVYLIVAIGKLSKTLDKIDALVDKNAEGITSIITNLDEITQDTSQIVDSANKAVISVSEMATETSAAKNTRSAIDFEGILALAGTLLNGFQAFRELRSKRKNAKLQKSANKRARK